MEKYSQTPKIDRVFDGTGVFIDWKSGLDPAIYVHYSTPKGDPLIHRAKNPVFMPNYPGWGFHRFNPWRERFDVVIQNVLQAGLVDYWKQKTWIRMKEEQSTGDKDPGERDPMAPLGMDDLQVSRKFEPGMDQSRGNCNILAGRLLRQLPHIGGVGVGHGPRIGSEIVHFR